MGGQQKVEGQHVSSVQCCYSRQQRSPSQPAMRSACEVSACSGLTDINAPRGCAPNQPNTAQLGHQIRCVCDSSAWLEAQQPPSLDRSSAAWWPLQCGSTHAESSNFPWFRKPRRGMIPLHRFPMCDITSEIRGQPDRQNVEIASET